MVQSRGQRRRRPGAAAGVRRGGGAAVQDDERVARPRVPRRGFVVEPGRGVQREPRG